MTAISTPKSQPHNKPEELSAKAMRLADRIAGVIERTLELYEAQLAIAEANPTPHEVPVEEHPPASAGTRANPAAPRAARNIPDTTPRIPNGAISLLTSLNRLVRSMEILLRAARHARELERRGVCIRRIESHAPRNQPTAPGESAKSAGDRHPVSKFIHTAVPASEPRATIPANTPAPWPGPS